MKAEEQMLRILNRTPVLIEGASQESGGLANASLYRGLKKKAVRFLSVKTERVARRVIRQPPGFGGGVCGARREFDQGADTSNPKRPQNF
ncbi:hypothetical protein SKAU_G00404560 [Synaphobranchus kaupii]|uniref:Uncharacterized protein n=1 Tax=Synaphobranchus kaupii TaxID=118154 RepID=A0A9Q1ICQ7_SYNKA|nr:hypothetical protein SKAU_G00404560 [Synaphobranchus kaupii]